MLSSPPSQPWRTLNRIACILFPHESDRVLGPQPVADDVSLAKTANRSAGIRYDLHSAGIRDSGYPRHGPDLSQPESLPFENAAPKRIAYRILIGECRLVGRIYVGAQDPVILGGRQIGVDLELAEERDIVELTNSDQAINLRIVINCE